MSPKLPHPDDLPDEFFKDEPGGQGVITTDAGINAFLNPGSNFVGKVQKENVYTLFRTTNPGCVTAVSRCRWRWPLRILAWWKTK